MTTLAQSVANPAANTSDYKVYADVTSATIAGRLFHVELVKNNEREFLSFTMITNLFDGDETGTAVKFTTSDAGMMKMFAGGWLPNGRRMTVIGQVKEVRNSYTNKDGELVALKRPELKLIKASVILGASPKKKG